MPRTWLPYLAVSSVQYLLPSTNLPQTTYQPASYLLPPTSHLLPPTIPLQVLHPAVSSVLYLSGAAVAGPTVVLDQRYGDMDPAPLAHVSHPADGHVLFFPGDRLHGVGYLTLPYITLGMYSSFPATASMG